MAHSTIYTIAKLGLKPINKLARDGMSKKKKVNATKKKNISTKKRNRVKAVCSICNQEVLKKNLKKHVRKAHSLSHDEVNIIVNNTMALALINAQKEENEKT